MRKNNYGIVALVMGLAIILLIGIVVTVVNARMRGAATQSPSRINSDLRLSEALDAYSKRADSVPIEMWGDELLISKSVEFRTRYSQHLSAEVLPSCNLMWGDELSVIIGSSTEPVEMTVTKAGDAEVTISLRPMGWWEDSNEKQQDVGPKQ